MAEIIYNTSTREFHLCNQRISYILSVLENGQLGQLYFGKKLTHRDSFAHFIQMRTQSHTAYVYENDFLFSLDTIRQEYPSYGTTDFREPAYQIEQGNGSRITGFAYKSHEIYSGKKKLNGLPAIYTEDDQEAVTLDVILEDPLIQVQLILSYTIFEDYDVVCRNAKFVNHGCRTVKLNRAMSLSIDLYDDDFEMIQLDGAWSRERHIVRRKLVGGIQSVSSARGASSMDHNPFIALKRPWATEQSGEVYGFCLIYSGNFLAQVEVDRYETARVMMGINPFEFSWMLETGEEFQTPEGVMVYSCEGLNGMSQNFHSLFTKRLVRGPWREKERPILLNNWEATFFKFDEKKILDIAEKARHLGAELFVLDDGWFGKRDDAGSSLGDWYSDLNKLPDGVEGLSKKIAELGLEFGLWFEPEMINKNSELYQNHGEWVIRVPERPMSQGRNQYVLDFSNPEVVDHIYNMMHKVLSNSKISYIKWDMNRNITEAYGATLGAEKQGEFFHRYILGVYDLYEKLIQSFPDILFESCASGGGRFDAGMLYYAPQCWASDDTDAVERIKIQYGTSMVYPLSSIGAHVSAVPNHQVKRMTSIGFRANVAFFGAFGYELDPNQMTEAEQSAVMEQIQFYKKYRNVFQYGRFYRLKDPFENQGDAAWMVVSEDRKTAIVSCYKVLARPNPKLKKVLLRGLDPQMMYVCAETGRSYYGDELMNMGLLTDMEFTGSSVRKKEVTKKNSGSDMGDFTSQLYVLECRAQGN
ncbi:alpha-galactosidase [Clostridium sp. FS41]|uniref:alpha-galactosidase n=1 Tax=Clostridia TaxID=186801 RepID=UPI0005D42BD7|nr:alpha-galactosidase [Clostridium sp. FS41]KJJ72349.1 alpha-galactosidase [Clostridium sp. FS41]